MWSCRSRHTRTRTGRTTSARASPSRRRSSKCCPRSIKSPNKYVQSKSWKKILSRVRSSSRLLYTNPRCRFLTRCSSTPCRLPGCLRGCRPSGSRLRSDTCPCLTILSHLDWCTCCLPISCTKGDPLGTCFTRLVALNSRWTTLTIFRRLRAMWFPQMRTTWTGTTSPKGRETTVTSTRTRWVKWRSRTSTPVWWPTGRNNGCWIYKCCN